MNGKFDGLVDHLFSGNISLDDAKELLERSMIKRALEQAKGNQCAAARQLGIHRNTLQKKMETYGLTNGRAPQRKPVKREQQARKRKSA